MRKDDVINKLKHFGFPNTDCRVITQLTQDNSSLMRRLGYDDVPYTCDVISIEKNGLVTGLRKQEGHKTLTHWDRIVDIIL